MKIFPKLLFIFALSLQYALNAQEVIKTDTLSGTPLTITMDPAVNEILNDLENNCARVSEMASSHNPKYTGTNATASTPKVNVPSKSLSTAEICRQNPRILGYKIQLTVVKTNAEANEVKAYFRRRFPTMKVEVDASLRPNYKVLAGSYFTKQSASGDLAKIKAYFKSAMPVPYRVFCVEAK